MPRHRGGGHTWDNLVAACKPCNHRKGGRVRDEARMRLLRPPFEPRSDVYSLFTPYLADPRNEAWRTTSSSAATEPWRDERDCASRPM